MKSNGAVLYESPHHVVIVTGLAYKSKNRKVGADSLQIWILPTVHPAEAVRTGQDASVCGDCPLRGNGQGKQRGCYVKVWQGPLNVWKAWQRGNYPLLKQEDYAEVFGGRFIRFGAYGEPVLIPFRMIEAIAQVAESFTGYTHQWRNPWFSAYKRYLMASCDAGDYQEAIAQGWRVFAVSREKLDGLMTCPASHEFEQARGWKLDCSSCGGCAGLSVKGRSVQIQPHGFGKQYVNSAATTA